MLKLLDNLWAKLFALVIGLLIWFHVATEKTYNYEVHLPITKVDLKENLTLARPVTDTVMATVTASGKQLLREQWLQRGVRLNAVQYAPGEHSVALSPSNLFLSDNAAGVRIHEVLSPATVTLEIDNQFVSRVRIAPALEVSADNGFAISRTIEVSPEEVNVVGPRAVVKELKSLTTESRTLVGLRTDAVMTLAIAHPAGVPLRIAPDSVTVTVRVVAVKTRTYANMPVVVFNTPPDLTVATDPAVVTLDLAGSPDDIDLLNRNTLTISADYRQQNADGKARLKVDCPSGFRVARLSVDSVRIIEGK